MIYRSNRGEGRKTAVIMERDGKHEVWSESEVIATASRVEDAVEWLRSRNYLPVPE